ncbi:MAG: 2-oxoglutarate dehydrogenase [Clostridiaceae bacterium]
MTEYKRRFGDRYDGRRIRTLNAFYRIIPFIMRTRADSQNYFEDKIEINSTESYLRKKKKECETNIGMLHVLIAAMVRTIAMKPALNRFIAGQKIYARNDILVSLAIKKELKADSPETTIKFKFKATDTISQIAEKINSQISENKIPDTKNNTDKTARLFMMCPGMLVKFLVFVIRFLDYFGIMPRVINEASPFHTSFFITDLGSLGIQPIYHHLYDFGTTSFFIAFGTKAKEKSIDNNNNIIERKYITMKAVTDERITDGHYYASAFKLYKNLIQHPEKLEFVPDKVECDVE